MNTADDKFPLYHSVHESGQYTSLSEEREIEVEFGNSVQNDNFEVQEQTGENQQQQPPRRYRSFDEQCDKLYCTNLRSFVDDCKDLFPKDKSNTSDDCCGWSNMCSNESLETRCACGCGCRLECCWTCLHSFHVTFQDKYQQVGQTSGGVCDNDFCRSLHTFYDKCRKLVDKFKNSNDCDSCDSVCRCSDELCKNCLASFYEECRVLFSQKKDKSICGTSDNFLRKVTNRLHSGLRIMLGKAETRSGVLINKVLLAFIVPISVAVVDIILNFAAWSEFLSRDQPGLVYGAMNKDMITAIGAFCIVGAALVGFYGILKTAELISFICTDRKKMKRDRRNESIVTVRNADHRLEQNSNQTTQTPTRTGAYNFKQENNKCKHEDDMQEVKWECYGMLIFTIMIYFGDLPQDLLWISVFTCYERDDNTYLSYKAIFQIVTTFFRSLLSVVVLSQVSFNRKDKWSTRVHKRRWVVLIGVILQFVLSSILTYLVLGFTRDAEGVRPRASNTTSVHGYASNDRYLSDMSVFLNSATVPTDGGSNGTAKEWMRLFYIEDLMQQEEIVIRFKYHYDKTGPFNMAAWTKVGKEAKNETLVGCYSININKVVVKKSPCPEDVLNSNETYFMKFQFVTNSTYFIGQILFNVKVEENGTVWDWDTYTSAKNMRLPASTMFHYFRHWPTKESFFLYHKLLNKTTFYYNTTSELTDAGDIWRTGFRMCKCSASLWPAYDPSLEMSIL